ncbi:MAG: class I SAM-dependent methyltransferase [Planctomycetes bacterium]|nr:class I SAM-dependent methyltransferase [Planctomycetota bacterium]
MKNDSKVELRQMYDSVAQERHEIIYRNKELRNLSLRKLFGFNWGTQYFMMRKINETMRLGRFKPPDHLLEIGCMVGHYSFYMNNMGFRTTGVDLSAASIQTAKKVALDLGVKRADFVCSDVETLSKAVPENYFDGVFSYSTLRYLSDPSGAISEIYKVLKPGGTAVVDFPNVNCPWFEVLKPFTRLAPHIHDHLFTREQIEGYMRKAGFIDIRSEIIMFSHKSIPAFSVPGFAAADAVLENLGFTSDMGAIIFCRGAKR